MINEQYRYELTKQQLESERCLAAHRRLARETRRISPSANEPDGTRMQNISYVTYSGLFL